MHTDTFILGAGGHGKVVLEALLQQGQPPQVLDSDGGKEGEELLGCKIMLLPQQLATLPLLGHVAVGNNQIRESLSQQLLDAGRKLLTVCHPRAAVAKGAVLGEGCFIAANAIVGPDSVLGEGCIVNHGAVIDHDCRVGRFSHIAPNATLGGTVVVGSRVLVGSGAVLLPGVCIGDDATIGAGAVVTKDVVAGASVVGVPARGGNDG